MHLNLILLSVEQILPFFISKYSQTDPQVYEHEPLPTEMHRPIRETHQQGFPLQRQIMVQAITVSSQLR